MWYIVGANRLEQALNFAELMSRPEQLLDELRPFLVSGPVGWPMLKHPYLYEMIVDLDKAALINERFKHKKRTIEQYYNDKNYSGVLALAERPYRLEEFRKFCNDIPDKEYWESLGWIWTDSENIWEMFDTWKIMLNDVSRNPTEFRQFMMDEEERKVFDKLPEIITIYRGCSIHNKMGFSWTLDISVAMTFVNRLRRKREVRYLIKAECNKENVIAYFDGRNEKEIVVDSQQVTVRTTERF